MQALPQKIFSTLTEQEFALLAMELFQFQCQQNTLYQTYCQHLRIYPENITQLSEIPFLPVSFFKTHQVVTTRFEPEIIFSSSGTSGMQNARHEVKSLALYEKSFLESFRHFYGAPEQYCFLALLPNYLEREGSSLVYMLEKLISCSCHQESGFYLYEHQQLYEKLLQLKALGKKTILFGVSFALLDFAEHYHLDFPELIIFETGGMKGQRKEMVKEELHALLQQAFGVPSIHSEYGMCELLSQAYSSGKNVFQTPPWMKILFRDEKDPFHISDQLHTGGINIIDLANIYSCAFIATDDLGRKHPEGVEIIGRLDGADIRGCNLLTFSVSLPT